jgi:predicted RNA polymerase sigma factor
VVSQPLLRVSSTERAAGEQPHGALRVALLSGDCGQGLKIVGSAGLVPGPGCQRQSLLQMPSRAGQLASGLVGQRQVVERDKDREQILRAARCGQAVLILLFLCCHPVLSPASQIALTLRAVGGLTTAEIARAFLVPEATMTRRISRAKQAIAASGVPFRMPSGPERAERLGVVLHVLYLIFNEGYAATSGASLHRAELSAEAIRLARVVRRLLPSDAEVAGLLALMLLTDARRDARTGPDGALVPMAEQDRSLWDGGLIAEGVELVTCALARGPAGPYQLQAAIAAVHDEAPDADATDWPQIVALYELLMRIADNPVVALNHAVAVAMVQGPRAGLQLVEQLQVDDRIAGDHRLHAVRGHLLEMAGERAAAGDSYLTAARQATSLPQQRYLNAQAARLAERP